MRPRCFWYNATIEAILKGLNDIKSINSLLLESIVGRWDDGVSLNVLINLEKRNLSVVLMKVLMSSAIVPGAVVP